MIPARRRLALLMIAAATSLASAQEPPRFRSGVELLRINVTVVDRGGQPVTNLTPPEFSVTVDGKPRPVRFVHFYGPSGAPTGPSSSAPLPSYALNTSSPAGRVVVLAVDLFALKQGYEKLVLDAAAKLVDGLGGNDAVGLMPIPGRGVDLTRDHRVVSDALRVLRGTTNVPFIRHYFTIREAVAFEQRDRRVIAETIERECSQKDYTCPTELRDETRELLRFARQHVSTVLTNLSKLADALQAIDAPKTIVLISAGLPFEQESFSYFTELQRALARSGTMIYSVQVEQPDNDASNLRRPGVGTYQANDIQTGLANVATIGGGAMFAGIGTAAGAFERLRVEVTYSYELGVDASPADADGKPHDIKVSVSTPGATVRARREVILPDEPTNAGKRLGTLLAQPVDRAEIPVALTAYSVRGEASDTLKVIINGQVGPATVDTVPVEYALVITKDGAVAFQTNGTAQQERDAAHVVLATQLAPGQYRARLAAVDAAGRGGTVELPISVGLRAVGPCQTSDLLVGTAESGFRPAIDLHAGQPVATLLELYCSDPSQFPKVQVGFELRRASDTIVVAQTAGALRTTDSDRRQVADGHLESETLDPGEYVASAVISENGRPLGRVSRRFRISPQRQ